MGSPVASPSTALVLAPTNTAVAVVSTKGIQTKTRLEFATTKEAFFYYCERLYVAIKKWYAGLGGSPEKVAKLFRDTLDKDALRAAYDITFMTSSPLRRIAAGLDAKRDRQTIVRLIEVVRLAQFVTHVETKLNALKEVEAKLAGISYDGTVSPRAEAKAFEMPLPAARKNVHGSQGTWLDSAKAKALGDRLKANPHDKDVRKEMEKMTFCKMLCVFEQAGLKATREAGEMIAKKFLDLRNCEEQGKLKVYLNKCIAADGTTVHSAILTRINQVLQARSRAL